MLRPAHLLVLDERLVAIEELVGTALRRMTAERNRGTVFVQNGGAHRLPVCESPFSFLLDDSILDTNAPAGKGESASSGRYKAEYGQQNFIPPVFCFPYLFAPEIPTACQQDSQAPRPLYSGAD